MSQETIWQDEGCPRVGDRVTSLDQFEHYVCDRVRSCRFASRCMAQPIGSDAVCFEVETSVQERVGPTAGAA